MIFQQSKNAPPTMVGGAFFFTSFSLVSLPLFCARLLLPYNFKAKQIIL